MTRRVPGKQAAAPTLKSEVVGGETEAARIDRQTQVAQWCASTNELVARYGAPGDEYEPFMDVVENYHDNRLADSRKGSVGVPADLDDL